MTSKDNPPKSPQNPTQEKKIFNPDLKSALSETADMFSDRSDEYNQISSDIKSTEEFLRDKGVKDLFTLTSEKSWDAQTVQLGEYESAHFTPVEALDWRFDHTSKKFRLMVTRYFERPVSPEFNDGYDGVLYIYDTRPLIECSIPLRVFYSTKLEIFVRSFANALESNRNIGKVFEGVLLTIGRDQRLIYGSHIKSDHEQEEMFEEKGIKKITIYPGGLSDTLPRTVREVPLTGEEIERLKFARLELEEWRLIHEEDESQN